MKKILRYALISVFALFSTAAMADTTTLGAEDNTSSGWTDNLSAPYTIEPNKTLTLQFQNFSCKEQNWYNWFVMLTQDVTYPTDGCEYLVLRADNYAWQYGQNSLDNPNSFYTSMSSNYNWDTFKDDMDGSTVVMTITRVYANVTVHADITTAGGTKYFEEIVLPCGDGTQNIRAYLAIDRSHLVIDNSKTAITDSELPDPLPEGTVVGTQDCTTGWWGAHSALNTIEANKTLHLEFHNFTAGVENYHNWVLVLTDGKYVTDAGYGVANEYLILRADNYGWGSKYATGEGVHFRNADIPGFDELTDQTEKDNLYWSTFREEMQGAYVIMDIKRWDSSIDILVGMVAKNGVIWYENFKADNFADANQNVGAFLTVDHSCLVIDDSKTVLTDSSDPSGIEAVKTVKTENGVRYNLAGQKVGSDFKGVVIENGKKLVVR